MITGGETPFGVYKYSAPTHNVPNTMASNQAQASSGSDINVTLQFGSGGDPQQHGGEGNLTTNQGIIVSDNQNSLKAGTRGPTLLEDFVLREKIFHFDHERIPERIVHARGSGAMGTLRLRRTSRT